MSREIKLIERQKLLLSYVISMHNNQKRKYTGEPYWTHCYAVGLHAAEYNISLGIEIGLCHDLIEDTDCELYDLLKFLMGVGYDNKESLFITRCVDDLTDKFTRDSHPNLNRKQRKELESDRLGEAHPVAQSIKYCDLINNTESICEHDPKFAKTYLEEKKVILSKMRRGHSGILHDCETQVQELLNQG